MEDGSGSDWHEGLGKTPKVGTGHEVLGKSEEEVEKIKKKSDVRVLGTDQQSNEQQHYGLGKTPPKKGR